jgi:hypothetical protein
MHLYAGDGFRLEASAGARIACVPIGDSSFLFDSDGLIEVSGHADYTLEDVIGFSGELKAKLNVYSADPFRFDLDAAANLCIHVLWTGCADGEALLSDRGIGVCIGVEVKAGITLHLHVGGGLIFPNQPHGFLDSCDIRTFASARASAVAGGAPGFTVPPGQRVWLVALQGQTAPPVATLTDPRGHTFTTPATDTEASGFTVLHSAQALRTTYVLIAAPAAGAWSAAPIAGSSPITSIQQGQIRPAPHVHARVTRSSTSLTLSYLASTQPGQQIRFLEQGAGVSHAITITSAGRGQIRFRPLDNGRAGQRKIIAMILQDSTPRAQLTVASFSFHPPRRPGPPRGLRARRSGTTLVISWRPVASVRDYTVAIKLSNGARRKYTITRRSLRLAPVQPIVHGTITVRAQLADGRYGNPSLLILRATRR